MKRPFASSAAAARGAAAKHLRPPYLLYVRNVVTPQWRRQRAKTARRHRCCCCTYIRTIIIKTKKINEKFQTRWKNRLRQEHTRREKGQERFLFTFAHMPVRSCFYPQPEEWTTTHTKKPKWPPRKFWWRWENWRHTWWPCARAPLPPSEMNQSGETSLFTKQGDGATKTPAFSK